MYYRRYWRSNPEHGGTVVGWMFPHSVRLNTRRN
jgi:hypothetical protein